MSDELKIYQSHFHSDPSVVSLGSQFFYCIDIDNALTAQMRHTMGQAMVMSKGLWEGIIDNSLWLFFLLQVIEISKVSLYRFQRFPSQGYSLEGGATLLVIVDARTSLIIHCFLVHPGSQGNIVSFLTHKCFLV